MALPSPAERLADHGIDAPALATLDCDAICRCRWRRKESRRVAYDREWREGIHESCVGLAGSCCGIQLARSLCLGVVTSGTTDHVSERRQLWGRVCPARDRWRQLRSLRNGLRGGRGVLVGTLHHVLRRSTRSLWQRGRGAVCGSAVRPEQLWELRPRMSRWAAVRRRVLRRDLRCAADRLYRRCEQQLRRSTVRSVALRQLRYAVHRGRRVQRWRMPPCLRRATHGVRRRRCGPVC